MLMPGGLHTEIFAQYLGGVNGNGFLLVVPDEIVETLSVSHIIYAAITQEAVNEAQYNTLNDMLYGIWEQNGYDDTLLYVKAKEEAEVAYMTALTVFPLFYLALVLTMTAAVILTIQQLSETERYKRQFELLRKLGMEQWEMKKALQSQFTIYYAMPAIPPVLISVPYMISLAGAVEPGIMVGTSRPGIIAGISLGLFFLIYAVYITLAYASLRRNVLP